MATVPVSLRALPLLLLHHFYSFLEKFRSPPYLLGGKHWLSSLSSTWQHKYLNPKIFKDLLPLVMQHFHFTDDKTEVQRWNPLAPSSRLFKLLPNGSVSTQSASLVVMGCSREKGSRWVRSSVRTPSFSNSIPVKMVNLYVIFNLHLYNWGTWC